MTHLEPLENRSLISCDLTARKNRYVALLTAAVLLIPLIFAGRGLSREVNTTNLAWKSFTLPTRLKSHAAVIVQTDASEFLYLIGGGGSKTFPSNTVRFARLNADGTPGVWNDTAPVPLTGIWEHDVAKVGNRIYVLGGRKDFFDAFRSVYCAKPNAKGDISAWIPVSQMPVDRIQHAVVAIDDVIFVVGGYSTQKGQFIREVWAADIIGNDCLDLQWRSQPEPFLLPSGRVNHSAVAVQLDSNGGKFIYVIGGYYKNTAHDQVWRAAVNSNNELGPWDKLERVPAKLFRHISIISGRYIYTIGGTTTGYDYLNTINRVRIKDDGDLDTWTFLGEFPAAAFDHAATMVAPGHIYVTGGISSTDILSQGYLAPSLDFQKQASHKDLTTYGDTITYTLTLTNLGVRDFDHLTITDTLNTNLPARFQSLPSECQPRSPATMTCDITLPLTQGLKTFTYTIYIIPPNVITKHPSQASLADKMTPELPQFDHPTRGAAPNAIVDLSLRKTGSPPLVVAGKTLTYFLRIENEAPNQAENVVLEDYLPDGVIADPNRTDPAPSTPITSDPLRWNLGAIPGWGSREIRLVTQVDPSRSGTLVNRAFVSTSSTDFYSDNNEDEELTPIVTQADLNISKMDSTDPITAGEILTYTLTVVNTGPSDAQNVVVVDDLPEQLGIVSTSPITDGPGALEWHYSTLPADDSLTIQIVSEVDDQAKGIILNEATVSSNTDDLSLDNNETQEETVIVPNDLIADLWITKADNPDPVNPGDVLTYTLLITNIGPSDATNVTITDTLPGDVCAIVSHPPECSGQDPMVCEVDTLSATTRNTRELQIAVTVCSTNTDGLLNEAWTSSDVIDPDPSNNTAEERTGYWTDLRLTKGHTDSEPIIAGTTITYALTVMNESQVTASNLVISDSLPQGTEFVTATPPYTLTSAPSITIVTWHTSELSANQSVLLKLVVQVDSGVTDNLINTAVVKSSILDKNPDNNTDDRKDIVYRVADLGLQKTVNAESMDPGETLTYTLLVTNFGPSDAAGVAMTDTLPSGICDIISRPKECGDQDPMVCELGPLSAGITKEFQIAVTVCSTNTNLLVNQAQVDSDVWDPNPENNQDTAIIGPPVADLQLEKERKPSSVIREGTLAYTLRIKNVGPSDAYSISVEDTLFLSDMPDPISLNSLVQDRQVLEADSTWTILITTEITPAIGNLWINAASVSSSTPDPESSNNYDETYTLVASRPVINQARICEAGLWCKVINSKSVGVGVIFDLDQFVFMPIILKDNS